MKTFDLLPISKLGLTKTTALLNDPDVTLSPWDRELLTLCIGEAGIVIELEFPDREAFERFQAMVAAL